MHQQYEEFGNEGVNTTGFLFSLYTMFSCFVCGGFERLWALSWWLKILGTPNSSSLEPLYSFPLLLCLVWPDPGWVIFGRADLILSFSLGKVNCQADIGTDRHTRSLSCFWRWAVQLNEVHRTEDPPAGLALLPTTLNKGLPAMLQCPGRFSSRDPPEGGASHLIVTLSLRDPITHPSYGPSRRVPWPSC